MGQLLLGHGPGGRGRLHTFSKLVRSKRNHPSSADPGSASALVGAGGTGAGGAAFALPTGLGAKIKEQQQQQQQQLHRQHHEDAKQRVARAKAEHARIAKALRDRRNNNNDSKNAEIGGMSGGGGGGGGVAAFPVAAAALLSASQQGERERKDSADSFGDALEQVKALTALWMVRVQAEMNAGAHAQTHAQKRAGAGPVEPAGTVFASASSTSTPTAATSATAHTTTESQGASELKENPEDDAGSDADGSSPGTNAD
jgi:hypothetical protein